MCTAITYCTKDFYFGRNLDLEYSYQEQVTITPRNFPFTFRFHPIMEHHYAMIGMATVSEGYPLYYDATNEKGLSMAGLNFPGNATYLPPKYNLDNITPFELIPWILSQCRSVEEAIPLLKRLNIVKIPFSQQFPLSPLHWILSDRTGSITVEPLSDGVYIYENPVGVLTNNPPFDYHKHNLKNYLNLTREEPENRFAPQTDLAPYSRGMGAIGLPGDLSSSSRFVRAAFTKLNSVSDASESGSISQFFHILDSVAQQRGCVRVGDGFEKTIYSSCCNTDRGIYYYTTYENRQITAVDMIREDLDGTALVAYPLIADQKIYIQNERKQKMPPK